MRNVLIVNLHVFTSGLKGSSTEVPRQAFPLREKHSLCQAAGNWFDPNPWWPCIGLSLIRPSAQKETSEKDRSTTPIHLAGDFQLCRNVSDWSVVHNQ